MIYYFKKEDPEMKYNDLMIKDMKILNLSNGGRQIMSTQSFTLCLL